jgi:nucleotide-binding universal stress UspA family protein
MTATTDSAKHKAATSPPTISGIAVGVDGFPGGKDAVALGAMIAEATHAELMLVSVVPQPLVVMPEQMSWKALKREASAMLRETRSPIAPEARMVVETHLSVPRALERVVRRHHRDLLVVGSSRRGPEGRVRIGKRTRQLLCGFKSTLAIAPRGMHKTPTYGIKRIGVGFDGGRESDAAVTLASSIARAAGADLHLCGVVDDRVPAIPWSALIVGRAGVPSWDEAVLAEIGRLRDLGVRHAAATGARTRTEILRGRPADALLELSEKVDLLVIGSRHWGPVARLLLGRTGEALAHDAACPLVVVPRPAG